MRDFVLSSESMTAGHPDKLCDQISDAMVDACLAGDPPTGCVAECAIATGIVFLSIRHGRPLGFDPAALARRVLAEAGYGATARQANTTVVLDTVETAELPGPTAPDAARAGHMTTAFGYACDHTEAQMPWPIWAAHRLTRRLQAIRREDGFAWLAPDAQVQVAARFEDRRPVGVRGIAITFHADDPCPTGAELEELIRRAVVAPAFDGVPMQPAADTRLVVQREAGRGGPDAHAGLTGRKTGDDSYGGFCRQGSSALSGKDPSRIDRVAAYAARQAAVSVLAAGLARECEVQLSYVAGDEGPGGLEVDTFDSGRVPDAEIERTLARALDLRVGAIVERLGLWSLPSARGGRFFRDLACNGHFGRTDLDPPWERPVHLG
jgi:S-adenosylmethionine synthetase